MKVLVTGAAGVLAREVSKLLRAEPDVEMRLTDMEPLDVPEEFVRARLDDPGETAGLCRGVDRVLHIAAVHPWKDYTPQQYVSCNIQGTWNVLEAAVEAGVEKVIYTSSIAAMGYRAESPDQLPFDEQKPCRPVEDIYGISKHVGEQFCESFRARCGLPYVALRPGCFIPADENSPRWGLGLLTTGVHRADIARGHVMALKSEVENEAVILMPDNPFTASDGPALVRDARSVILRYLPAAARLEEEGTKLPESIRRCYCNEKARRLLGFRPERTFRRWLMAHDT